MRTISAYNTSNCLSCWGFQYIYNIIVYNAKYGCQIKPYALFIFPKYHSWYHSMTWWKKCQKFISPICCYFSGVGWVGCTTTCKHFNFENEWSMDEFGSFMKHQYQIMRNKPLCKKTLSRNFTQKTICTHKFAPSNIFCRFRILDSLSLKKKQTKIRLIIRVVHEGPIRPMHYS